MYLLNLALLSPFTAIGLSMLLLVAVFIWYRTQKAAKSMPPAVPSHPEHYHHANHLQPTPKALDVALLTKPELPEIPLTPEERRIAQEYLAAHPF